MGETVCDRIDSGHYKTVRLFDDSIQLITGEKVYTFKEGDIANAHISDVSEIYPYDESPIDECFVHNGKVHYIRNKMVIQFDGQNYKSLFKWNPSSGAIPSVTIKQDDQTIGFFVPPKSQGTGYGQSVSQTNNLQIIAYGGTSSVSMISNNGNFKLSYNGWNLPIDFNAFIANPDGSLTFFNGNQYLVIHKNSRERPAWRDVDPFFGCIDHH